MTEKIIYVIGIIFFMGGFILFLESRLAKKEREKKKPKVIRCERYKL